MSSSSPSNLSLSFQPPERHHPASCWLDPGVKLDSLFPFVCHTQLFIRPYVPPPKHLDSLSFFPSLLPGQSSTVIPGRLPSHPPHPTAPGVTFLVLSPPCSSFLSGSPSPSGMKLSLAVHLCGCVAGVASLYSISCGSHSEHSWGEVGCSRGQLFPRSSVSIDWKEFQTPQREWYRRHTASLCSPGAGVGLSVDLREKQHFQTGIFPFLSCRKMHVGVFSNVS